MEAAQAHVKKSSFDIRPARRPVNRRKVVIGHPKLGYGGSESTMMWLIEALKWEFDVTVMTTGGWDLPALNGYYGTNVGQEEVKVRIAPLPFLAHSLNAAALRGACFQSFARQIANEYDLRISAYNTTDWGLPAIHFLADFSWNPEIRERFDPPSPGFIYRESLVRWAYLRIAAAYGKPSGRDVLRDDVLIANSHWTAKVVKQFCGVECAEVVYPPVGIETSNVPWEMKEQSFVMIGRIASEKRIERAIEILEKVRQHGHPIQLHLCGQIENDSYGQQIARLCREHASWVSYEGLVSGARKAHILSNSRFGIQARSAEPFGISVAEMVKAGAIVFAPEDGGQAEVIGHPDLLFSSVDDAVEKILTVLEDQSLQSSLSAYLRNHSEQFRAQTFVHEVQALTTGLLPSVKQAVMVS
jgi:glycosyltransferase involved in cell wall biosynthesis